MGASWTYEYATGWMAGGFDVLDVFYFVGHVRPQPKTYKQKVKLADGSYALNEDGTIKTVIKQRKEEHARTNISMLYVLRKR
jgi:hypothetical protein